MKLRSSMCLVMSYRGDRERRLIVRQAAVGLVVTASTASAELASYGGSVDGGRLILFGLSGLLSAAVVLLASSSSKKNAQSLRTNCDVYRVPFRQSLSEVLSSAVG